MNEYVENWKAEHSAIMNFLTSAVNLDICSKAGQEKMMEAKNMILNHLKSEDEVLYPMVKKVAREKVSMERMMEIFAKEMDELAPKVLAFFKEYEDNPMAKGLSSKLYKIISLLKVRIYAEENIFIKQYENIIGQADNENKML